MFQNRRFEERTPDCIRHVLANTYHANRVSEGLKLFMDRSLLLISISKCRKHEAEDSLFKSFSPQKKTDIKFSGLSLDVEVAVTSVWVLARRRGVCNAFRLGLTRERTQPVCSEHKDNHISKHVIDVY
jgi:hypothetical protein